MSLSDKPVTRPNQGSKLRQRAKTARLRFLETDVTLAEYDQIMEHCLKNKVSVSQFLAESILKDAETAKTRKAAVRIQPDLEFASEEYDKLELLAHLQNKSVTELIRNLIQPHLDVQRMHVETQTRPLRFYLSDREHEIVSRHLENRGLTARKYVSFLALRMISRSDKSVSRKS